MSCSFLDSACVSSIQSLPGCLVPTPPHRRSRELRSLHSPRRARPRTVPCRGDRLRGKRQIVGLFRAQSIFEGFRTFSKAVSSRSRRIQPGASERGRRDELKVAPTSPRTIGIFENLILDGRFSSRANALRKPSLCDGSRIMSGTSRCPTYMSDTHNQG